MTAAALIAKWSGPWPHRLTKALVLAGAATLPLQNAATLNVGFTLRLSDALFGLALVVGLPFAVRGLLALPAWLRWTSVALLAIYVIATVTRHLATIPGDPRAGDLRAAVYVGNLAEGAGILCLVVGLWKGFEALRPLLIAVTAGSAAAALYAVWQWPAQHYGLPFSNVINTLDSNGITAGSSQGTGILGWERVRGTFLEPHFLGGFMAAAAPLAVVLAVQSRGTARRLAFAAAALMIVALLLTSSAPAWAGFGVAALVACTAYAVGRGRPVLAAAAAICTSAALFAAPVLLVEPATLAAITGRSTTDATVTAEGRKETWNRVLDIWAARPAAGYGAGQSSVRLTLDATGTGALQSAQGLWASSLIDVGVVGLSLWLVLTGTVLTLAVGRIAVRGSVAGAALAMATVAALCSAFVTNDRLDLSVWLLFGIVAACALRGAEATG
jgi:O-antigen ligase